MQRWTSVAFGLFFAAAVVIVVLQAGSPAHLAAPAPSAAPSASAAPAAGPDDADAGAPEPSAGDGGSGDASSEHAAFALLPDGKPAPRLPATAPKTVDFGAILFSYRGAELAPKTAPTRQEALERARGVVEEAKKDFGEAAKKGDRGSTAEAGRIPRGVLEPALEYLLFTLPKSSVYDEPIDTPRGWWIVRRND